MACPEYERLRQLYEAALRHWGHLQWSAAADDSGVPVQLLSVMKQRAFNERSEAREQMHDHYRGCKICRSNKPRRFLSTTYLLQPLNRQRGDQARSRGLQYSVGSPNSRVS